MEGTYENKDYFYKLVLVDGNYNLMDILRNHSYTFTIIKAKGPGYDTVEDAKHPKLPMLIWIISYQLMIVTLMK